MEDPSQWQHFALPLFPRDGVGTEPVCPLPPPTGTECAPTDTIANPLSLALRWRSPDAVVAVRRLRAPGSEDCQVGPSSKPEKTRPIAVGSGRSMRLLEGKA
jgi:hypothetical protein